MIRGPLQAADLNVLISGTSGFIGGNLSRILGKSFAVTSIGRSEGSQIVVDFGDLDAVAALDIKGHDVFVHCAGVTDEDFVTDARKAYQRSTYDFSRLLERVVGQGIRWIIYFSAGQVYGRFEGRIDEDSVVNPVNDYSIAHYAAEQILRRFSDQHDARVLVVRPGAVYGLPSNWKTFKRWHLVPYAFPLDCVYKQQIVLRSSGSQQRDFVSIEDVAGYITSYLGHRESCARYSILNPTGNTTLSVYEFAVKCRTIYAGLTGKSVEIVRPETTGRAQADHFSYRTRYGMYTPVHSVEEYLEGFIQRALRDDDGDVRYGVRSD